MAKNKRRRRFIWLGILAALVTTFFLGPKPSYPEIQPVVTPSKLSLAELDAHVASLNASVEKLKPDNGSRIIWANDTAKSQTDLSVLFLHGFSASPREGYPVAPEFAKRYGANTYMPRLAGHGIDSDDSFLNTTPADLVHSARDALAIAKVLGKKTVVIGSSTGSTLAIYLAAHNPELIDGMYLFAPNVDLADGSSDMLLWPWGIQIGYAVIGSHFHIRESENPDNFKYWTGTYRTEGLLMLKYLLNETMTDENFEKVKAPVYASYYYQSEDSCDDVISIPDVKHFFETVSTPAEQKRLVPNPDAGEHVMTCDLRIPKPIMDRQLNDMYDFAEKVLGLEVPQDEVPDTLASE